MVGGKHIDTVCAVVLVLTLLLTGLFMNGEALGIEKVVDADAETHSDEVYFTENDLNGAWDTSSATVISLDANTVSGGGAYFYDGDLVISGGGRYVLSGTLTDGSIRVDADRSAKVWVMLNGVTVNCADDACLRVEQADKVFLTLAAGSENRFTSGETYSETALADNTGGAIFAHDDLTINGSGSLSVTAGYKHGIDANDDLIIAGGKINITCPQDGLHVNDSIRICDADITVSAGDDGIHSDTSFYIESGTVLISQCCEGIEAPQIELAGGDVTIYPTDDGLNANGGSDAFGYGGGMGGFGGGMGGGFRPDGETDGTGQRQTAVTAAAATTTESGQENRQRQAPATQDGTAQTAASDSGETAGESCIRISGGTLTIVNADGRDADGIDSNGSIYISGGVIRVSMSNNGSFALDVGSEGGGVLEISGGEFVGLGSYTMAESFDSSSAQPSILYTHSAGAEAGTTVALEDLEGNVLVSYTAPCAFSCVNLSAPAMKLGETYRMVIGDSVEEITLEEISASYGDARSGGFGGTMNFGGMGPRGGGGGGMRGGRGGDQDAEGGFQRPQGSELPQGGFQPPEDLELPEGSELPQDGFRRHGDGELPQGDFNAGGGRSFVPSELAAVQTETAEPITYDSATWLRTGVCLGVLALGLGFALWYRRRTR